MKKFYLFYLLLLPASAAFAMDVDVAGKGAKTIEDCIARLDYNGLVSLLGEDSDTIELLESNVNELLKKQRSEEGQQILAYLIRHVKNTDDKSFLFLTIFQADVPNHIRYAILEIKPEMKDMLFSNTLLQRVSFPVEADCITLTDEGRGFQRDLIAHFFNRGVNKNELLANGFTPLCLAAKRGRIDLIAFFLDGDDPVDINAQDKERLSRIYAGEAGFGGRTALHWAVYHSKADIVTLLLSKQARILIKDKDGRTALQYAEGNVEIKKLLEDVLEDSNNAEHAAYRQIKRARGEELAYEEKVEVEKEEGDKEEIEVEGMVGLEHIRDYIERLDFDGLRGAINNDDDTLGALKIYKEWLLQKQSDRAGQGILTLLIQQAKSIPDNIFFELFRSGPNHIRITLLEKKPDMLQRAWQIIYGINFPVQADDMVTLTEEGKQQQIALISYFFRKGIDKNMLLSNGHTLLTYAIQTKRNDLVRVFLNVGSSANINAQDGQGEDGVIMFSGFGGRTALHWAVYENNVEIVRLLLSKNPNVLIRDKDGRTVFDYAGDKNREGIKVLLEEWLANNIPEEEVKIAVGQDQEAERRRREELEGLRRQAERLRQQEAEVEQREAELAAERQRREERLQAAAAARQQRLQARVARRAQVMQGVEQEAARIAALIAEAEQLEEGGDQLSAQPELSDGNSGSDFSTAAIIAMVVGGCVATYTIVTKYFPEQLKKIKAKIWGSKGVWANKEGNVVNAVKGVEKKVVDKKNGYVEASMASV